MIIRPLFRTLALSSVAFGAVACGGGGSSSSGGVTPPPPAPVADTAAPSVTFNPTTLSLTGGTTGAASVTATDNTGVTTGPTVSCTNGGSFAGGTFTAPVVTTATTSACTATAGDAAGNSGTATLNVTITPDTEAPAVSFSATTLTLDSGETAASALSATDNVAILGSPDVSCTNGGSFAGGTFTAPAVSVDTTVVCTATVSDEAGNSSEATLTATVIAEVIVPDTEPPVITFNPATLTLASGSTGTSTLSVTDDSGETLTPTIACTNGGSFEGSTFTPPIVTEDTEVVCTATAADAAGNSNTADLTVNVTPQPTAVTISGSVTFDHVPFNTSTNGLNFGAITQDPAPGLTVEAVNAAGTVLQSSVTDAEGNYSLAVDPNTDVRIRVLAEMVQTSGAQWDVRVIDNTSADVLYALQGAIVNSGSANSTRDLNAASGWGGSSYTSTRAAAPFAILAPIYESIQRIVAIDPDVVFPSIGFNWSPNNRPGMNGNLSFAQNIANGDIGTSSYVSSTDNDRRILILGDANNDTDEYDEHVVIHEWGHYFEDQLSRSDSIGGQHGQGDRLDPRVALGEGFGNAISGMMTDDPFYRDSFGASQSSGFEINVEGNNYTNEGWFNEGSVQSILYDIFDSVDDAPDSLSAGLEPIYNVLTSESYRNTEFFTTIFLFLEEYRDNNAGDISALNAISSAQSISGTNVQAAGETNNGRIPTSLPLYNNVSVNGSATEVCVNNAAGDINKLGNRIYITFNVTSPGTHTISVNRSSGASSSDPDFSVFSAGTFLGSALSGANNSETASANLTTAGLHLIDLSDFNNGDVCYDVTITR